MQISLFAMKPFVLGLRLRQMSNDVKLNMPESDSLQFSSSKAILTLFFRTQACTNTDVGLRLK